MTTTPTSAAALPTGEARARRAVVAVALLAIALDMSAAPAQAPAVALAAAGLHASFAATAWLAQGFDLAYIAATVASLWAIARWGSRRYLAAALAAYAAGSALCAIAPSPAIMIAARIVAGAGLGGVFATALLTIVAAAPPSNMPIAMTALSAVMLAVPVLAPLGSGVVLAVASWAWVFAVLALDAAVIAVLCAACLRDRSVRTPVPLDGSAFGALLIAAASFEFLVVQGPPQHPNGVLPIVIAAVALAVCAAWFVMRARQRPDAFIDVRVFGTPLLAGGFLTAVLLGALLSGAAVQAQEARVAYGLGPAASGAFVAVRIVGVVAGLIAAAALQARGIGVRPLTAAGLIAVALTGMLQALAPASNVPLAVGIGIGIAQGAAIAIVLGPLAALLFGAVERPRFASLAVLFELAILGGSAVGTGAVALVAGRSANGSAHAVVWVGFAVIAAAAAAVAAMLPGNPAPIAAGTADAS